MATVLGQANVGGEVLAPGALAELASPIAEEPAQAAIRIKVLEACQDARQQSVVRPDLRQAEDMTREELGGESMLHADGARQRTAAEARQQLTRGPLMLTQQSRLENAAQQEKPGPADVTTEAVMSD
jgi:hypothetical protein